MLKIRLQRVGRRNSPSYRIVTTDSRTGPKSARHVDILGSYNPKTGDITLHEEKIRERLAHGAQASGTVHNMLVEKGIIDGKKVNVLPKKSPIAKPDTAEDKKEEPVADTAGESEEETPAAQTTESAPDEGSEASSAEEAPAEPAVAEKEEESPAAAEEDPAKPTSEEENK